MDTSMAAEDDVAAVIVVYIRHIQNELTIGCTEAISLVLLRREAASIMAHEI